MFFQLSLKLCTIFKILPQTSKMNAVDPFTLNKQQNFAKFGRIRMEFWQNYQLEFRSDKIWMSLSVCLCLFSVCLSVSVLFLPIGDYSMSVCPMCLCYSYTVFVSILCLCLFSVCISIYLSSVVKILWYLEPYSIVQLLVVPSDHSLLAQVHQQSLDNCVKHETQVGDNNNLQ